jgi:diadenosine tetraphosphate (Ap4A) HIT family hydrolase
MNQGSEWELHPQLVQDTLPIGDLPLSRVLASKDAGYPWVILVPRRAGVSEIIDLGAGDQVMLMTEIAQVSTALKALTECDKLNVANIGNIVAQLHVHVVARRKGDAAWPKAMWGAAAAQAYAPGVLEKFVADMRKGMGLPGGLA